MRLYICVFIIFSYLLIFTITSHTEDYYKWVDDQGVTHVTDNPNKVPKQYRSSTTIIKEKETGFTAYYKKYLKTIKNNKNLIFILLAILVSIYLLNKLIKLLRKKSELNRRNKFDEVLKKSGIDTMTIPQFKEYSKNLLSTAGFKIRGLESDLDFGVDFIADKGTSSYLVKVISNTVSTSRTVVNDVLRDTSKYGCDKAMLISKNFFSEDAIGLSKSSPCELIDRQTIGEMVKKAKLY